MSRENSTGDEHAIASMKAGVVSTILKLKGMKEGQVIEGTPDIRHAISESIDKIMDEIKADDTSWEKFKGKMFYDVYLLQREEEGTLTPYDLTRGGLTALQFAETTAYHEHCIRVSGARRAAGIDYETTKVCSTCGEEKPANKFKYRGGAKCNACRSKEYRERKREA